MSKEEIPVEKAKTLMNDCRIKILKHLSERRYTASELAKLLGLSVPTVIYHLTLLEKAGFVRKISSNRKWKYYELTETGRNLLRKRALKIIIGSAVAFIIVLAGLILRKSDSTAPKSLGGGDFEIAFLALAVIVIIAAYAIYRVAKM